MIFLIFGMCSMLFIASCIAFAQNNQDKQKHIENQRTFQWEYDAYVNKLGYVRRSDTQVTLIEKDEYGFIKSIPHYLWISENNLSMFPMSTYYKQSETSSTNKPDLSKLKLKLIPLDSIMYFEEIGKLHQYKKVYREKNTWKTYALGETISDASGEIIGVREPIKTSIEIKDDRKVRLFYKNEDNSIVNLEFAYDAYEILKRLISQKELVGDE